jgi:Fe-S-cluster containining protein
MSETAPHDEPGMVTAQVEMNLAGRQVQFTLTVPQAPVAPSSLLPILHILSETVQNGVAEALESEGKRISCRAGCGACCRQLVPVTKVEAQLLTELVESLPEPRRTEIRARFDAAVRRLDESGLLGRLRQSELIPRAERESLGLAYFALGIPCPFLEDESCSIHADRPLVCREFLVTSPPELCANPAGRRVEGVKLPVRLSNVLARLADPATQGPMPHVLLPLLMERAEARPGDGTMRPGPEWVSRLFALLSGGETPGQPET